MKFPQYLWRIGYKEGAVFLRRGHDCNEPIRKFLSVDFKHLTPVGKQRLPFGVMDACLITDSEQYAKSHPWDWLNE